MAAQQQIPLPRTIQVALGERSYPIMLGRGNIKELPALIERTGVRGAIGIVTDDNVGPLYLEQVQALSEQTGRRVATCVVPAGEAHKRLDTVEQICGAFLEQGLDRAGLIIALGGGVVGDMAGFAAGVFMRGIPFLQIPTTIVSQVDSSVGGKTGVNHVLGKNTIGVFHQPLGVLIDLELLRTLPRRELIAGMAEAIKHGLIADAELFAYLEAQAQRILESDLDAIALPVLRSCEIKAAVVAQDEKEHGLRANLNYGHTFGHAIESASGYTRFLHGEAIAIGMCAAGILGRDLELVDQDFVQRQKACFEAYGLPVSWPELPVDACLAAMQKDKKRRAGALKFIVPTAIGAVEQRSDVPEALARKALEGVKQN